MGRKGLRPGFFADRMAGVSGAGACCRCDDGGLCGGDYKGDKNKQKKGISRSVFLHV